MNTDKSLNTFGDRLKTLRESKRPKLSQQALGVKLGQTEQSAQPHVSKLEKNTIEPSITELILISEIFNVSIDWLLGRDKVFEKEKTFKTMQDIISALFTLEEADIEFTSRTKKDMEYNPYTENFSDIEIVTNYISFDCPYLNDFLQDWEKAKDISKRDGEIYKNMYKSWKEDELEKAKEYSIDGHLLQLIDDFPF